eukprot:TRINITY_DN59_c0_g1_i3.p2 TRINITY_DN59_c0_g1~~TRINITY_DN59_c0_g1_i3.p2  ORF type:complete len:295 (+),score=78.88 TRINITY_DN59_c0_g1_i3:61-945(+)
MMAKGFHLRGVNRDSIAPLREQGYKSMMHWLVSKKQRGKMDLIVYHENPEWNTRHWILWTLGNKQVMCKEIAMAASYEEEKRKVSEKTTAIMIQVAFETAKDARKSLNDRQKRAFLEYVNGRLGMNTRLDQIQCVPGNKENTADIVTIYYEAGSAEEAYRLANNTDPAFSGDIYKFDDGRRSTLHSYQVPRKPHVYLHSKHQKKGKGSEVAPSVTTAPSTPPTTPSDSGSSAGLTDSPPLTPMSFHLSANAREFIPREFAPPEFMFMSEPAVIVPVNPPIEGPQYDDEMLMSFY